MELQVYPRMDIRKEDGNTSLPKDGYKKGGWKYRFFSFLRFLKLIFNAGTVREQKSRIWPNYDINVGNKTLL